MKVKRICFTGHRDIETCEAALKNIAVMHPDCLWVHGGAIGFDSQVEAYAQTHGIRTEIHRAEQYPSLPYQRALLHRNEVMVATSDLVVACYDGRIGGGTAYTVDYAQQHQKPVEFLWFTNWFWDVERGKLLANQRQINMVLVADGMRSWITRAVFQGQIYMGYHVDEVYRQLGQTPEGQQLNPPIQLTTRATGQSAATSKKARKRGKELVSELQKGFS